MVSLLLLVLGMDVVVGFSYAPFMQAPWKESTTTATLSPLSPSLSKKKNPRYPDLPLDHYLANPYFHKININYPGLQLIHENPFIFIINDLFSDEECDRLITKAMQSDLRQQVGGGNVERTSNGIVCENEEVPTLRRKMATLTNIQDRRQLQYLKVSRYMDGQTFSKHTDAWPTENAPISKGWVNEEDFFGDYKRPTQGCMSSYNQPYQNNFMTSFVYLNDVPIGGCTTFPNIGIHTGKGGTSFYDYPTPMDTRCRPDSTPWDWDYGSTLRIQPEKGMAVLHFCSTLPEYGGICDGNTFHIAEPPQHGYEKFVSQQFFASCPLWDIPEDSLPIGMVSNDII